MSFGRRLLSGGAGLIVVAGLAGCTSDDPGQTTDADIPTGSVDAPSLESGDGEVDGSSPGTLVVGGSDPADADPAAPEGQSPDVSVVPPPEDGATPTSADSGGNPPDVSTQATAGG